MSCHTGQADKPFSLLSRRVHMKQMKRYFSESYLRLTHAHGPNGNPNHALVNWIDCMSESEMLPPYHRGSATSGLMTLLRNGHEDATLTEEELDRFACWIDLLVPYCGDYLEANAWSPEDRALYRRYAHKRQRMQRWEQANIAAFIAYGHRLQP